MPLGLSTQQAQEKLLTFGLNIIVDNNDSSPLKILFRQIKGNFVIYMLFVAAIISFFVGKETTSIAVGMVIIMVIGVGFIQEYKAEEAVASLKKMLMPISILMRDGVKVEIPSTQIVPDDIVVLGNGEKIPADCVIVESHELRVNEAALTGESKEVSKESISNDANIQSSTEENMLFMGTYIVNGRCLAKVTHTGMNTKFGKIAHLISTAEKELPLAQKVNQIAKYMVTVAIFTSLATGGLMFLRTTPLTNEATTEILVLMVALAVSAFPEGFPVVLITTLAVGAKRMAKKNAIVNRMSIIETLGEVTLICSDKTGTLTRGEMTVKHIFTGSNLLEVEGSGYVAHGSILQDGNKVELEQNEQLKLLLKASVLSSDAEIQRTGFDNEYKSLGSPTEAALLVLGAKAGIFKDNLDIKRIDEKPFNSDRKMMSVLGQKEDKLYVYAKGAPEIIFEKCTNIKIGQNVEKLTESKKDEFKQMQLEMAQNAYRTLCIAYKEVDSPKNYSEENLTLLGLVAMEDPPRQEAKQALLSAQNAGIRVIMATGDNKETAASIGRQLGFDQNILEGRQIDEMSDQELAVAIKNTAIYARVRPEHKIRLVKLFKEAGEIVAMTGDGVNDAPALKEAHVGIAMGKNGTDVSRSAADLVLKDDNFATIIAAISEGRTSYNNIRKFVSYQLSCSLAELIILFLGVVFAPYLGWQTPILVAMQILFMNLVTDNLPAITLGVNPTSEDIMNEKPRNKENILTKQIIKRFITSAVIMTVVTLIAYYWSFNVQGLPHGESQTIALVTLILAEIVMAFNYRSFRKLSLTRSPFVNKYLVWASIASILATIFIIYTPAKKMFETTPIGLWGWGIALLLSLGVLIVNDISKIYRGQRNFK